MTRAHARLAAADGLVCTAPMGWFSRKPAQPGLAPPIMAGLCIKEVAIERAISSNVFFDSMFFGGYICGYAAGMCVDRREAAEAFALAFFSAVFGQDEAPSRATAAWHSVQSGETIDMPAQLGWANGTVDGQRYVREFERDPSLSAPVDALRVALRGLATTTPWRRI